MRSKLYALAFLLLAGLSDGAGPVICHPSEADHVEVVFTDGWGNTKVELRAFCGGGTADWYVSFYADADPDLEGVQPGLWSWYEFTNTASKLIRGPARR